jgi:biotin transport system substrate-specific component
MRIGKLTTRDLCLISVFTALIIIMAQISIPMPMGVPMTMQTFAVTLAGMLLGAKKGFLSVLAYLLLGAFGLPVFHSFTGGAGMLVGPTGGFLLSFPLMAWLIGLGAERGGKFHVILGLVVGTASNYLVGMLLYSLLTQSSLAVAFTACVAPFIPTAIIKAVAAGWLGAKVRARALLRV